MRFSWIRRRQTLAVLRSLSGPFDFARSPRLGKKRFKRAVEAQERAPSLARNSLYPIAVAYSSWLAWSEIHGRGAIGVRHGGGRRIALAAGARIALRSVEHRTRH